MATKPEYAAYVCDQLRGAGEVAARKMFGEYGFYLDGKLAYTIEGTPEMLPQHYDLDLRGALQMKVQATPAYGDFYFFANAELK